MATNIAGTPTEIRERERGRSCSGIFWVSPMVIALYAFSVGPVMKLQQGKAIPDKTMNIYLPLIAATGIQPETRSLLNWYVYDVWRCSYDAKRCGSLIPP